MVEEKIEKATEELKKNGFDVIVAEDGEEALSEVLEMVSSDSLVGVGGSVALREVGVVEALDELDVEVANHWRAREKDGSVEEVQEVRKRQVNSDIFLTGSNAVTETGKLVNIDGIGQRVAAMVVGDKKVIVVVGVNKITEDVEEGLNRARNVAAPKNAERLDRDVPCIDVGECVDCDSTDRICNVIEVIEKEPIYSDITVIFVKEDLGY